MAKSKLIDNQTIGKRIRQERKRLKLTQLQLSEMLGLSDYYVGQIERGDRQMSLPVMVSISSKLHLSLDYLILGKAQPVNNQLLESAERYSADPQNADPLDLDFKEKMENYQELLDLLYKCTDKELSLFKALLKTVLPYVNQ